MKASIFLVSLLISTSVFASGNYSYFMGCELKNVDTGEILDTEEIAMGVHAQSGQIFLQGPYIYGYADVKQMGYKGGYLAHVEFTLIEQVDQPTGNVVTDKAILDAWEGTEEGKTVFNATLQAYEASHSKYQMTCKLFSEYYED